MKCSKLSVGTRMIGIGMVGTILGGLLMTGCASDAKRRSQQDMIVVEKKSDRQTVVEYDGACAMALAEGKYHIGNEKYVLQHDGKTYYFGSAEAKQKFEQNLNDNIQRANHNWENSVVGLRQPSD